jgi:hypothetical protein
MQLQTPASAHDVQHATPGWPLHAVPGAPQQNVVSTPPAHVCPAGQVLSRHVGSQAPMQFTSHAKETATSAAAFSGRCRDMVCPVARPVRSARY